MSKSFLDKNQQQDSWSNNSDEVQKKIDPVAQLKWLNNHKVDYGFGIFNNSQPAQMSEQEEEEEQIISGTVSDGEAESETDSQIYIITNGNAVIRSDDAPHNTQTENKIPIGTKVTVIGTSNNRSQVQYTADANSKHWTSTSNLNSIETVSDTKLYTAFYNDIAIYSIPEGNATENVLEVNKKYSIVNKCETSKNKFYEVKKDGTDNTVGWIKDYKNVLYGSDITDRKDKLKKFKDWLNDRLTEAEAKTGDEKITFVQGILGLIEKESANIAKDPPVYPNVESLDKSPTYSSTTNPNLNTAVPHELISITRNFINITELTPATEAVEEGTETTEVTDTETTGTETAAVTATEGTETAAVETVTGGSQHSVNDWNSRLGAPQYRTQSDNLSIPEATCNVTTMAMTLERLGNSRANVVTAINTKLKNGEEKTEAQLKSLWEEKSKAYLERITTYAEEKDAETAAENDKNYLKLRQNKGGLVGKESDLSKKFKEIAQMEDLLDFYMYLKTSDLGERYSIFKNTYNDVIPEDINSSSDDKYSTERINVGYRKKRFNNNHRNKIKKTLDDGGSAVISVFHKGTTFDSHIISVQSINSEGLIVDDPYGGHATDYIKGSSGDLFKGKGKTGSRSDYNYKNVSSYNSTETDYTKRDFTAEAGQNLDDDESRGDSFLLKYKMINNSTSEFINYIVLYEKK